MMICFALASLTTLCSASWFIVHQHASDNSGTHSAPDTCDCHFTTEATYNGTAQFPTLTDAGVDIYGTDAFSFENVNLKFAKTDGITISGNKTITVATGNFDSATGVTVNFTRDVVWNWAGEYTCKIVDSQTGQTICSNHTYTIKQAKMTPVSLTLPTTPLFEDTSVSYTALWRGFQNGVDNNSNPTYDEGIISGTTSVVGFTDSGTLYKNQSLTISASNIAYENDNQTYADKFYNNYDLSNTPSQTGTYTVLAKAYSYDSSNGAKFHSTLNRALEATKEASTATTVVAMQSFTYNSTNYTAKVNGEGDYSHTISGARTVGANVTLVLPFRASSDFDTAAEIIQDGSGNYGNDRFAVDTNDDLVVDDVGDADGKLDAMDNNFVATPVCVNEVVLTGQLTVNGHVQICGITGVPYPSSSQSRGILQAVTSGKHATLTMKGDSASSPATLTLTTATTTLKVHGYIAQGNEYTKVIAQKGTISMPFVVYDYGGGGSTIALFKGSGKISYTDALKLVGGGTCDYLEQASNICPFSAFDMPNIQVMLECYGGSSGATIEALCTLFTNSISFASIINLDAQFNPTTFNVFAPSNALIQMSSGTATFHYDAAGDYRYEYDGYIPARSTRTEITLSGTTTSGNVTLSLSIGGIIDSSVTFADIKFPISDKLKLTLTNDYTYTFTTAFKFLPGSELYITNGAKVNVGSSSNTTAGLLFYNKLEGASICYNFYTPSKRTTPAVCNIANGSLVVYGSIGGTITASSQNGIVNLNNASALSMNEVEGIGDNSGLTFTFTQKQNINLNVSGYTATNDSYKLSDPMAKTQYSGSSRAVTATSYAWKTNTITATLDANGGSVSNTTPSLTVPAAGYTTANLDSTYVPTRTYYTFQHWCTSQNCTNGESCSARPSSLYQNTTLYAIWTPNTYTLNYDWVFDGFTTEPTITKPSADEFTVETPTITMPTEPETEYEFGGWYTDEACTKEVFSISGKDLLAISNGDATIYGLWVSKQYKISYVTKNDDNGNPIHADLIEATRTYTDAQIESGVTLNSLTDTYLSNTSEKYYFAGWLYNGNVYEGNDFSFIDPESDNLNYTLTANWVRKVSVKYTANTNQYTDLLTNGSVKLAYDTEYWYPLDVETNSVSITLPNITKNDGTTTDAALKYYFASWSLGDSYGANDTYVLTEDTVIAITWGTKATFTVNYGNDTLNYADTTTYVVPNTPITINNVYAGDRDTSNAQYFDKWTISDSAMCEISGTNGTTVIVKGTVTLTANWLTKVRVEVTATKNDANADNPVEYSYLLSSDVDGNDTYGNASTIRNAGTSFYVIPEHYFKFTVITQGPDSNSEKLPTSWVQATEYTEPYSLEYSTSCITSGTLITLADGTQKKVEDLTLDDVLLVFNHETGKYEAAGIIFIENDGWDYYNVINLTFSNGTTTKLIYEHALFDVTLNKYVYITETNYADFVGHEFAVQSTNGFEVVTLTDAYVAEEYTGCYSLVTVYHLNYFIDGLFSIPGGIDGLFNIFEYDENLKFDEEKMQADIEKYGLFTYNDFAEYIPEEVYEMFPAAYFKIAIGKGMLTFDQILEYIEQFLVKNGIV